MLSCQPDLSDDFDVEEDNCEIALDRTQLEAIASKHIDNYFLKYPPSYSVDLFSPKHLELVITTDVCRGVDMAYEAMARSGRFSSVESNHSIGEDIRFVIKTLKQIRSVVPHEYSAGILLMHLEFLEGIPL